MRSPDGPSAQGAAQDSPPPTFRVQGPHRSLPDIRARRWGVGLRDIDRASWGALRNAVGARPRRGAATSAVALTADDRSYRQPAVWPKGRPACNATQAQGLASLDQTSARAVPRRAQRRCRGWGRSSSLDCRSRIEIAFRVVSEISATDLRLLANEAGGIQAEGIEYGERRHPPRLGATGGAADGALSVPARPIERSKQRRSPAARNWRRSPAGALAASRSVL